MQPLFESQIPAPAGALSPPWSIEPEGRAPVVATAIHAGHAVHPEVARHFALDEDVRLREEDPGTELFTELGVARVVVRRSRFEVDLNRPREGAVYAGPDAAWGLEVWRDGGPQPEAVDLALDRYDAFYAEIEELLSGMAERWGCFAVYDIHSYNHRRRGPAEPPDDPEDAPEINVGTGGLDRERWGPVVDRFLHDLAQFPFFDRRLDVRENVRFEGGHFPRWIARRFPDHACPLAIEVKKIYMDEWTGQLRPLMAEEVRRALASTLPGVSRVLAEMSGRMASPPPSGLRPWWPGAPAARQAPAAERPGSQR